MNKDDLVRCRDCRLWEEARTYGATVPDTHVCAHPEFPVDGRAYPPPDFACILGKRKEKS